ncbi:hypothetical protein CONPUDRAFT_73884 [Coniophora puteana RWD-64-598 SS2]|uniref:Uncharacterized protein n=1 Tax=Coniophora puteana (strain RWD-64-598) TaxID=741705 RepID=A0A5M3MQ84_CONPW|nr:uncharacterized protein CONPUDRAFT_73884 [Coniophora puteana RWD-64-598 SS2]EIW80874.1 hypothetical protein CONPUDRAFT_73884 [Coniophora puteana RWD-64-598 SS2]
MQAGEAADAPARGPPRPSEGEPAQASCSGQTNRGQMSATCRMSGRQALSMKWSKNIEGAPISEEHVQQPAPHGLDDVQWNTSKEKLGDPANPESVPQGGAVPMGSPDGIAPE